MKRLCRCGHVSSDFIADTGDHGVCGIIASVMHVIRIYIDIVEQIEQRSLFMTAAVEDLCVYHSHDSAERVKRESTGELLEVNILVATSVRYDYDFAKVGWSTGGRARRDAEHFLEFVPGAIEVDPLAATESKLACGPQRLTISIDYAADVSAGALEA